MSEFFVMRSNGGLSPHTMEDAAVMAKLPFGKPCKVTVTQQRNARFHALYWVLCSRIANAVGAEVETVSDMLKIGAGHATLVKSKTLGTLHLPKSISFAKMDETSFRSFFEKCVDTIYAEWSIDRKDVLEAVNDLLMPGETGAQR